MFIGRGVNQGPFGSEARKHGIDNSNSDKLFSNEGLAVLRTVLALYRDAGANIGGAPTFRLTDFRVKNPRDWEYDPDKKLYLTKITEIRNKIAVQMARGIFGSSSNHAATVGLLAPISDTSGGHDKEWAALGNNQIPWAMQRQRPQMEVLNESDYIPGVADIDAFWFEAMRYVNEAKAIAKVARELAVEALVINFEADENGIPDPAFKGRKFTDVKKELQEIAGSNVEVLVGANCTGISNIRKIWERNDRVDVAYPNELDLNPAAKLKLSNAIESQDGPEDREAQIQRIINDHRTEFENVVRFWKDAVRNGVRIIGGCCGTTPEHTWVARKVFDETT